MAVAGKSIRRVLIDLGEHTFYHKGEEWSGICLDCFRMLVVEFDGGHCKHHFHAPESSTESESESESTPSGQLTCCECGATVRLRLRDRVLPEPLFKMLGSGNKKRMALYTLSRYVSNLIKGETRPIPGKQSGPLEQKVGVDENVRQVLTLCGFRYEEEGWWYPPQVIDDLDKIKSIELELIALASLLPPAKDEKWVFTWSRFEPFIERMAGNEGPSFRVNRNEHSAFKGLGIDSGESDMDIYRAYTLQCKDDPDSKPSYLEYLESIAEGKESEYLRERVREERQAGAWTRRDLEQAAERLGVDEALEGLDDDLLITLMKSRINDNPADEAKYKEALQIFGRARNSLKIEQALKESSLSDAYSLFRVGSDVDDEFLTSTFAVQLKDNPSDEDKFKKALDQIAQQRNSTFLKDFIANNYEHEYPMTFEAACGRLGVAGNEEDELLITVFNLRKEDNASDETSLRKALEAIGKHKNSYRIQSFLTGIEEPILMTQMVDMSKPVGLENIGNTCYLNSLLQYYFTIKPLRDVVLSISEYEEDELNEEQLQRKRIGGRIITAKELKRAKRFTYELKTLFEQQTSSRDAYIKPKEELAYLALVSSRDEDEDEEIQRQGSIVTLVEKDEDEPGTENVRQKSPDEVEEIRVDDTMDVDSIAPAEAPTLAPDHQVVTDDVMQVEETELSIDPELVQSPLAKESDNVTPISPLKGLSIEPEHQESLSTSMEVETTDVPHPPPVRRQSTIKYGKQQDVTECLSNVMFQIESSLKPTGRGANDEQLDIVKSLFYGKEKHTFLTEPKRFKEEVFSSLIVDVSAGDGADIYDALDGNFDISNVTFDNSDINRFVSLVEAPPVLQIQIQRVQFDRERGEAYKSNAFIRFYEKIYLDRYMDGDEELASLRLESWDLKKQYREVRQQYDLLNAKTKDGSVGIEALQALHDWLSSVEDTPAEMNQEIGKLKDTYLAQLDQRKEALSKLEAQKSAIFSSRQDIEYRLHSVFIHRGSAFYGHYFVYIQDFKNSVWYKFNDEYVTVVSAEEVFADTSGTSANPYMLTYVRSADIDKIVEVVHRE